MFKNILVPTDGSALSRSAIAAAVKLAKTIGAKVTAVYAAPPATPLVYKSLLPVGYGTSISMPRRSASPPNFIWGLSRKPPRRRKSRTS